MPGSDVSTTETRADPTHVFHRGYGEDMVRIWWSSMKEEMTIFRTSQSMASRSTRFLVDHTPPVEVVAKPARSYQVLRAASGVSTFMSSYEVGYPSSACMTSPRGYTHGHRFTKKGPLRACDAMKLPFSTYRAGGTPPSNTEPPSEYALKLRRESGPFAVAANAEEECQMPPSIADPGQRPTRRR